MKYLNLFLFLLMLLNLQAQEYKPFHAGSNKLYLNTPYSDSAFSIRFDTVIASGIDSLYYNHSLLDDIPVQSDTCMFWGGPSCRKQLNSWLGRKVKASPAGVYTFYPRNGDSLMLDFSLASGDTLVIYQDLMQRFRIIGEGKDTLTWLGFTDSVASFRLIHHHLNGNPIPSALQNYTLKIGKQLGLIQFFRIDQFPNLLQPMVLYGNSQPDLGKTIITGASLYDHHAGDVIQYYESHSGFGPQQAYQRYTKHQFLSRTETPDSLSYSVIETVFEPGNTQQSEDTVTLSYYKHAVFGSLPFDRIDQTTIFYDRYISMPEYCGIPRWTYTLQPGHLVYCAADTCWGQLDTGGPPLIEQTILVEGLGIYRFNSAVLYPPPQGYTYQRRIHYFKKDGLICGNEAVLSAETILATGISAQLIPNPAGDRVRVEASGFQTATIWLSSPEGRVITVTEMQDSRCDLSLNGLKNGIYFVRIFTEKGITNLKLLKQAH